MGYTIELNYLLKLPKDFNHSTLTVGKKFTVTKEGERLFPLHKPIEFCNSSYTYIGKVKVSKIMIEENKTTIFAEVLSLFSEEESQVYTKNFIK